MPSRSRERQLAKLAARRQAERSAARRRRNVIIGTIGAILGIVVIGVGVRALTGGNDAGASASESPTPSVTATPSGLPKQVGQVTPQQFPPAKVACGASKPAAAGKPKPQFANAPSPDDVLEKGTTYTAVMRTSCGTVEIELLSKTAPATVASFVFLAEKKYFDGQFFHRIDTSIDVIQGGDPLGTGSGGPGYTIPDELTGKETYGPGTQAMANAGPDSGGSQFFFIFGDNGHNLDGQPNYTVFGKVTSGLDVLETIGAIPVQDPSSLAGQQPTEAVYIDSVKILTSKG
jgi:peptidyl-prolyl cis-trans isomerase B (cyclophilin B)